MGDILVYIEPIDDYIVTVASSSTEIAIEVVEEHEVRIEAFEYPAEITVLSAKIREVEEVATEANSAATTALAAATTAQSSADAAMAQAEAATDMAATNTLSISSILSNFTAWVLGTYLGALTLLDAAIAAGDSIQAMAGKLQGQLNAVKVRLGLLEDDLIYELTLSAAVQNFTISLDKNNNVLSLSECRLILITPSAVTANFLFRINGITSTIYNGMASNNSSSFAGSFGQDGSVCDIRLMYDSTLNMVSFSGITARKYPTNLFQTVPLSGFTNSGSVTTKITSITMLTNTGLFAVGTKVILKKK